MRIPVLLLFVVAASPVIAAKHVTVQQLQQTLVSLHDANKSDDEIATQLKQVQLGEELTPAARNDLTAYLPGPLSTAQMEILRGLSAFEAPPSSDLPSTPAPDPAAQKAILSAAGAWINNVFNHAPPLAATKTTARYQDNVQNMSSVAGLQVDSPSTFAEFQDARTETVETSGGVEKVLTERMKTKWGENGQISEGGPIPPLPELLDEANSSGKLAFVRWQTIQSRPVAVFSFAVDKKKSRYNVVYCCFPQTDTATGVASAGGFAPAPGEIQSVTTWRPLKKTVPYHGFLFVDPANGAIVRTQTYAELKPGDYVHLENVRIDYGAVSVDGKGYLAPFRSYVLNEVVPGGDTGSRRYSVRHTLFTTTYTNYRLGSSAPVR